MGVADNRMSEGNSAVLYRVTIGGPGSFIVHGSLKPATRDKQCSMEKLLGHKLEIHGSNSSRSWLLPANCVQHPPRREQQMPANWLSAEHNARQSKRVQQLSAGKRVCMTARTDVPKYVVSFEGDLKILEVEQPGSAQLGPYAPAYGASHIRMRPFDLDV